ncbi:hypothetical protein B0E38_02591 [Streptomyces sp. 111WW2]|uniref:ribbon-helix-helix domain-containing protein n=1 Tax=Streptomyces sp. 111WW2 TaxID=1945515 RepID=UPI000D0C925E|nr:CopG family transcriptional regulator [Streptomyces sp. 111WW2]PSK57060.1 hypothetical protein B0E38_02591 [Streptomyces sp. 111WW2]
MDNSTDAPKDGQRAPSKVGISFPPDVMDRIDVAAALRRMSRQDWIREAVAAALAHPPVTDTERAWGVGELPGDAYLRDVIERQVTVSPHQDEREALDAEYASLVEVGIGKPSADRVQTPYWALAIGWVQVRRAFLRQFGTTLRAVSYGRHVHVRTEAGFRCKMSGRTLARRAGDLLHETDSSRRKNRDFAEADDRIPRCDYCWDAIRMVAKDLWKVDSIITDPGKLRLLREWTWDDNS